MNGEYSNQIIINSNKFQAMISSKTSHPRGSNLVPPIKKNKMESSVAYLGVTINSTDLCKS